MSLKKMTNRLSAISENETLNIWAENFSHHPQQLNYIHQSDAELLKLPFTEEHLIAATIDTIAEEIELKFYQSPETIGWVAAMASLSDLAAVGARPLGILVSASLGAIEKISLRELQHGIAKGIEAACRECQTFVLGGDTNIASKTSISVCALGNVSANKKLTRQGAIPGDLVYTTGLFGDGATLAAKTIYSLPDDIFREDDYRPVARLKEGHLIANFATACMDTSDGLISTLDQLARINQVGIDITLPVEHLLSLSAKKIAKTLTLPPFPFIAAQHGEFELIFTMPATKKEIFEAYALKQGLIPILIGKVTTETGVYFDSRAINTAHIRNLLSDVNGDLKAYLEKLLRLDASLSL